MAPKQGRKVLIVFSDGLDRGSKDRLNEARQIAGNIGGAALIEVQRQSRVLDYFTCRLKIEQESQK